MSFPLIVIMGATASGKSSLAVELSKKIPIEIISADSMQIYRKMNIGSAKPDTIILETVPHHMIDMLDISERLDVFFYKKQVDKIIEDIVKRGKYPVLTGGSGLYIKAVVNGLDLLPSDSKISNFLCSNYDDNEEGRVKLLNDLLKLNFKIDNLNTHSYRKMIRAMEVFQITGKHIYELQSAWSKNQLKYKSLSFTLLWKREELFNRIIERTEKMLNDGWLDETKTLISNGLLSSPTAKQAIGYPIIANYLEGKISYSEMKIRIISATKKYARRQETWFLQKHSDSSIINMPNQDAVEIILNSLKN